MTTILSLLRSSAFLGCFVLVLSGQAQAQSQVSAISALSVLPVASVVTGSADAAVTLSTIPVVLSAAGAVLVVRAVESTARGTVYVLERASDGARASLMVAGKGIEAVSVGVGTAVVVSVFSAGVILSAAGQAIAFLPNEVGRALMHNERVTK